MANPKSRKASASGRNRTSPANKSKLGTPLDIRLSLLRIMLAARMNDEMEEALKRRGQGHFQLSCFGHEALAGIGLAMDENDWLHPYYRDRAICLARGLTHRDNFLDFFSKEGSASNGRQMPVHYNSRRLRIATVSSPVGTNMLQAVGMANSLKERGIPEVVVATIGDAATREGEVLEAIAEAALEQIPILFVIEDNGYGISTSTIGRTFWTMPNSLAQNEAGEKFYMGCPVLLVNGLDPLATYERSIEALERIRSGGGPTLLIAHIERLCSHSSSDDQRIYRGEEELKRAWANDPVTCYERRCIETGWISADEVEQIKAEIRKEIDQAVAYAMAAPDPKPESVIESAFAPLPADLPRSETLRPKPHPKRDGGLTMAQVIATVLEQEMRRNERIIAFGEDIEDPKGDVFSITRGLSRKMTGRVRNSPLAEATIMGTAVGRAMIGDLPVACIQFVDFMGPALNQLFNEAITTYWRSNGDWNCPMVIMAPYGAYLPGLGPWHSQTNEAIYAHMPGLHVVIPSSSADAGGLLRFALRCNRPVLFLYPKALLHRPEDTIEVPNPEALIPFGISRIAREGRDLTIVTWGNCVDKCLQAAERAKDKERIECEVLDLRTLVPWDRSAVMISVKKTGRLLVVHEDAKTCGFGSEIVTHIATESFTHLRAAPLRIVKPDEHNPYHYSLELSLLPSVDDIFAGIRKLRRIDLRVATGSQEPETSGLGVSNVIPSSDLSVDAVSAPADPQSVEILVPKQSPTDEDAVLLEYHVKSGAEVQVGTLLATMEANKGSFDIESTHAGIVETLLHNPGQAVLVETPILTIRTSGRADTAAAQSNVCLPQSEIVREVRLSPAQLQVGALALKSQLEIPTVDCNSEADVTALAEQRESLKERIENYYGVKLTYNHLIVWSIVQAMKSERHEGFRGRLDATGEKLLIGRHVNLAFAAIGPNEDLYTPVIKEAEKMDLVTLIKRVNDLVEQIRSGRVHAENLKGATVTLTNIGAFDATSGKPFVIPGQVAMICTGTLLDRPRWVGNGSAQVSRRIILPMKLVFDHRPFNGSHATAFLRTIKSNLQNMKLKELLPEL